MNQDGETLRLLAPEFNAGQETTLAEKTQASPRTAPAAQPQQTISAPADLLAEEDGLARAGAMSAASRPDSMADVLPKASVEPTLTDEFKRMARFVRRAAAVAVVALFIFALLSIRSELRARRMEERSERLEAQQAAHVADASRMMQGAPQTGTIPPPAPRLTNVTGGLKMPDKPKPNWLRPDKDGVCRNQKTGEELRTQAVIRGTCWFVSQKMQGEPSCPSDVYDPPPEVLKDPKRRDLHEACFRPWEVKGGQSVEPRP